MADGISGMVETGRGTVEEWQRDHMGHINVRAYMEFFEQAVWPFYALLGMPASALRAGEYHRRAPRGSAGTLVLWENGFMKTTLELPDELLQRIKLRAVHRKRKLKDEIAELLESGIAQACAPETPRQPPKPVRLRDRRPVTLRELEAAIAAGRG